MRDTDGSKRERLCMWYVSNTNTKEKEIKKREKGKKRDQKEG